MALEIIEVPIGTIHPNPWNPNRMDERTFQAERESIQIYGFIDPVTARAHPEVEGEWQIIDGEQRWRAAQEEGLEVVSLIPVELSDEAAMKLTVILNETRGEADVALLGKLLNQLREGGSEEELMLGLSFTTREVQQLTEIGREDWASFQFHPDGRNQGSGGAENVVELHFTEDELEKWRRLLKTLLRERGAERPEIVVLDAMDLLRQNPVGVKT